MACQSNSASTAVYSALLSHDGELQHAVSDMSVIVSTLDVPKVA